MFLFFDTETTGLPRSWQAPVSDLNNWPRMVQLAFLAYDKAGNRLAQEDFIIRPDGYIIPPDASAIHGISQARALAGGSALSDVLARFSQYLERAEGLIAHNKIGRAHV